MAHYYRDGYSVIGVYSTASHSSFILKQFNKEYVVEETTLDELKSIDYERMADTLLELNS
jgi:hypothetical protein